MHLPIKWKKNEAGEIIGYERYTEADLVAIKEAKLLEMYEELQALKAKQ